MSGNDGAAESGRGDPQVSVQPAHVDAALSSAHGRLTYQYGPVWQGDYWTLMWRGLTGRWESIRDDEQADDDTEQAKLVADGGEEVGREVDRRATCQSCGGDVLLEVDFGDPHKQDARIYAECDGCGKSAWLSWEEIPSRTDLGGAESDD